MTEPRELVQIADLTHLLSLIELKQVRFNELSARRAVASNDDSDLDESEPEGSETGEATAGPVIKMFPKISENRDRLRVIVEMGFRGESVEINAELQLGYVLDEPIDDPEIEVLSDFLGKSAMSTAVPYLREALGTAAARLEVQVPFIQMYRPQRAQPDTSDDDD